MKPRVVTVHDEQWLLRRLREQGTGVLDSGVTTAAQRREIIREAIDRCNLTAVIVGRDEKGKPVSYAEAYERLYSEPHAAAPRQESAA